MSDELREALEGMVWQYAYRITKGRRIALSAVGSSLRDAFDALGWANPHYVRLEAGACEVAGCYEWATCGWTWGHLYLSLCSQHRIEANNGKPLPKIRVWALKREAKRDSITRELPIERAMGNE